ncbi:MAG: hypothetical protein AABZ64_12205 [Nitrospinota bacterium]
MKSLAGLINFVWGLALWVIGVFLIILRFSIYLFLWKMTYDLVVKICRISNARSRRLIGAFGALIFLILHQVSAEFYLTGFSYGLVNAIRNKNPIQNSIHEAMAKGEAFTKLWPTNWKEWQDERAFRESQRKTEECRSLLINYPDFEREKYQTEMESRLGETIMNTIKKCEGIEFFGRAWREFEQRYPNPSKQDMADFWHKLREEMIRRGFIPHK